MMDFIFDVLFPWFVGISLIGILGGLGYIIYDDFFVKHEYISLRADHWTCSKTIMVRTMMLLPVGKVLVPTYQIRNECVEYKRK